jgi:hypothetical protein
MEKIVYIVEEHHEAYFIWHYARSLNPAAWPAHLFHVDAHPDMDLSGGGMIPGGSSSHRAVMDFVYNGLDIQTFITPAVYGGFFQNVTWVAPGPKKPAGGETHIWSAGETDGRLFMSTRRPDRGSSKTFHYRWTGLDHPCPKPAGPVVLDIDLDFFASSPRPVSGSLEITEAEYRRYRENPRHLFRLHFGSRIEMLEKEGRYHAVFTPDDAVHRAGIREVNPDRAERAVAELETWLKENRVEAGLITVCRSRLSGFSPKGLWERLEKRLMDGLESLYGNVTPVHVDSLYEKLGLAWGDTA